MFYKLGVGMEWEGFLVVLGCTSQAYTLNVPSVNTKQGAQSADGDIMV